MNNTFTSFRSAFGVALVVFALSAKAEDYDLLKLKASLLVEQAKGYREDSFCKGNELYGAAHQYYFTLVHASGTNLLARAKSSANEKLLASFCELAAKDYAAYTKVAAAEEKAAATGRSSGDAGCRHRAKRIINAEKLGDKELKAAIIRWEQFAKRLKKR